MNIDWDASRLISDTNRRIIIVLDFSPRNNLWRSNIKYFRLFLKSYFELRYPVMKKDHKNEGSKTDHKMNQKLNIFQLMLLKMAIIDRDKDDSFTHSSHHCCNK